MIQTGRLNKLRIVREAPSGGLYLDGGEGREIMLPRRCIPAGGFATEEIEVFIYRDSDDWLIATTETPLAMTGDFASLKVVSTHPDVGAFLDWGLAKDLLLPLREQRERVREGDRVVVRVFLDEKTDRVVATTRLDRFLDLTPPDYREGQEVSLLIESETPLGWKAIINNTHRGLLYREEAGTQPQPGERVKGYIRSVRPDGKIDLGLDPTGWARVAPLSEQILEKLKTAGGRLPFHDKSHPEEIRRAFGCSKKSFKHAIGSLYREHKIRLLDGGFELVPPAN